MSTTPDYATIITAAAQSALKDARAFPDAADPSLQFLAALHGTLQGTLNAGRGDSGTLAAFQALDALFQHVQAVTA